MTEQRRLKLAQTVAAAVVAGWVAGACGLFHSAWLEVSAGGYSEEREWPMESGEFVTLNNSYVDSAGTAGIEIDVFTPDYSNTLTVDSLFGAARPARINVPDAGEVSIFVRLYQNGTRVAEGHLSWTLQSGVNYWRVVVERAPYSALSIGDPDPLRCGAPLCHRIQRIEINEGARNYPDEALWVQVERYDTGGWRG